MDREEHDEAARSPAIFRFRSSATPNSSRATRPNPFSRRARTPHRVVMRMSHLASRATLLGVFTDGPTGL
eukprot:250631-Prymnesium_polylepis.1